MGQKLRGLVGQSMSGQRKAITPSLYVYGSTSNAATASTFTAPRAGWFRFIMWGGGGGNPAVAAAAGSGGALVVAERALAKGQTVALSVGTFEMATSATFGTGEVLTAGGGLAAPGAGSAGGVAVGNVSLGDILVNGPASTTGIPAAGASFGTYIGGQTPAVGKSGGVPGGGSFAAGGDNLAQGGGGLILICQVRIRF